MDLKETENFMQNLAKAMSELFEEFTEGNLGFSLIVFDFDNPGIGNYISNINRGDMIKSLRETAYRLEKNEITEKTLWES